MVNNCNYLGVVFKFYTGIFVLKQSIIAAKGFKALSTL